jgi:RNA-directed DNA polymerase
MKFKINTAKTKLMTPGNRQTVTGIVVNEKPQVVFHKRNELRQAMYYIRNLELMSIRIEKLTKGTFETLLERINFVLQINPKTLNS